MEGGARKAMGDPTFFPGITQGCRLLPLPPQPSHGEFQLIGLAAKGLTCPRSPSTAEAAPTPCYQRASHAKRQHSGLLWALCTCPAASRLLLGLPRCAAHGGSSLASRLRPSTRGRGKQQVRAGEALINKDLLLLGVVVEGVVIVPPGAVVVVIQQPSIGGVPVGNMAPC